MASIKFVHRLNNRRGYVGNSPVNFTDPTGYCYMGCFWQQLFRNLQNAFRRTPILGTILQIGATVICGVIPACAPIMPLVAGLTSAFVSGVTSGNLGVGLRAGLISAVTAAVVQGFAGGFAGESGAVSADTAASSDPPMKLGGPPITYSEGQDWVAVGPIREAGQGAGGRGWPYGDWPSAS
jgi:hypothetical protein